MNRSERTNQIAEHIQRTCPNDIGGQMVLAAFGQDSIDREFPREQPKPVEDICEGCYKTPCECLPADVDVEWKPA